MSSSPQARSSAPGASLDRGRLSIYLNDHLAGALAGSELAARTASSNEAHPRFGPPLQGLLAEVRADRAELRATMKCLGVGVDRAKQLAGWAAEKAGRLKLNGQLRGYSPLSRVVELEALRLGVTGKQSMWRALLEVADAHEGLDARELRRLEKRAQGQLDVLAELHGAAISEALLPRG